MADLRLQIVLAGRRGWQNKSFQGRLVNRRGLYIERDIDPHRTGTAGARKIQRFFEMEADGLRVDDGYSVLRDGRHDGHDVDFLHAHLADAEGIALRLVN